MLKRLFDEIYIRDIETRHKVRNKADLEDLLNILSSSIGSLTNPEKLKNTFHSAVRRFRQQPQENWWSKLSQEPPG